MIPGTRDVAQTRLDNAMLLFDEFVHATIKHPDAATLRGLEGRFAERLQIQPSYWSQIKGRSRQIGERLARQFEQLCHKPSGWMDEPHRHDAQHDSARGGAPLTGAVGAGARKAPGASASSSEDGTSTAARTVALPQPDDDRGRNLPQDDDERFIVGLVLTYYRRHPQRARTRLLDLLGEVLTPSAAPAAPARVPARPAADDGRDLWTRTQAAVAPLKRKR